jgi:hypothetical protein
MTSPLTEDTIDTILNSQRGIFIATTICCNVSDGCKYQFPDGKPITATTPSDLIHEFQTWRGEQPVWDFTNRDKDYNQVKAFFEPQIMYASKSNKQKLMMDLLDYALELSRQL